MGVLDTQTNTWLPIGNHGSRVVEDYTHDEIHDGCVYRAGTYVQLATAGTVGVAITTPATQSIHYTFGIDTNGPGVAHFYDGITSSGGSTITPSNANRTVSTASKAVLKKDPIVASLGSIIGTAIMGSTGFKSIAGGNVLSRTWILAASTTYFIKFTADTGICRTVVKTIIEECD